MKKPTLHREEAKRAKNLDSFAKKSKYREQEAEMPNLIFENLSVLRAFAVKIAFLQ
jgi:hypothetical protein